MTAEILREIWDWRNSAFDEAKKVIVPNKAQLTTNKSKEK